MFESGVALLHDDFKGSIPVTGKDFSDKSGGSIWYIKCWSARGL